ncbi:DUF456 domain-containing protein [Enterococcus xiangfangensis]|uniref:DUF456 domain-containing protein n=1 Tax=Enterococcus xiangfangensis TaxID=1296537 RepID=A0ABU3FCA7_9ENTE|nr:DUF456 domain-containing protein [Enterococcus xiangfangensis]MBM7711846.1 putative membrane protein [Enterococcus xiangfangensis]MDT2760307.1 DUF456 domain-containing protein [Enterococcus xiangfangensis]NBK07428.1 DUF456 domain-containing protein [Enterococcus asini]
MEKRVIIMNFDVESKAYEAFSKAKRLHLSKAFKGEQMAVVHHSNDGEHKFEIEDFLDFTGSNKSSAGGLIGMLVGILGGPIGILLGWFTGGMIGATQDAKEVRQATGVFEFLIDKIGEGDTALLLIAEEEDNRPLNQLIMMELGGEITRLDYEEVEADVKKTQEIAKSSQEANEDDSKEE